MTEDIDTSWLKPIEDKTKQLKKETEQIRQQIKDIQQANGDFLKNYPDVTRVEVITDEGREFAKSQVFDADKFAEENNMVRNHRILERYNMFYNTECSGLSHGTPITPEFQQAMTLECMLDALRYENLNHEFDVVSTADINALIEALYQREEGVE